MKKMLVVMLAVILAVFMASAGFSDSFAQDDSFFDSVRFIQYLDENTALEEVRNGNLDIYYDTVSADRLENRQDRQGLQVYDATSRFYSILVNPAESDRFNPFSDRGSRFALNYLVDRNLIVNELMGGYGSASVSYYGTDSPEFLTIIEQLEEFNFKYNPALAREIITDALVENGAIEKDGAWQKDGEPIEITIFIRSDDPIRKSIGEILAVELERIGFAVKKDFGDLNKAFVIVYGSDPSELKWNLYTEAWQRSAFVKYDSTGLGHMYAPWFSNMPGFNDPSYWNYKNERLDTITQKIYTGNFETVQQRAELIQEAAVGGISESVRIFLANKIDQYVVNEEIDGVINDFGAGVPSRFTPINARGDHEELVIGVKQIYQGAWNPVMGMTDSYSVQIWNALYDPQTFKHPFTGETIPIRADWRVDTAGPNEKLDVPQDARIWNPILQKWQGTKDTTATSKVTFDVKLGNWHNGEGMDINDIIHALYFTIEWGTQSDENDKTFDTEYTPRAAQGIETIKGIRQIDGDTFEVYVDYWHFDQGEIAAWAGISAPMPWEITAAMEKAVTDGKASFSRSGATSKNVNWLSLIIPNDAGIIKEYLEEFKRTGHIPESLRDGNHTMQYYNNRYDASIKWIESKNHAVISNGPFYLEEYSPESRTIRISSFNDESYPFKRGEWSEFENVEFPQITGIRMDDIIQRGKEITIDIQAENSDSVLYFLTNGKGEGVFSDRLDLKDGSTISIDSKHTEKLNTGANSIKIFAVSDSVLKPDFYESSFIVSGDQSELPAVTYEDVKFPQSDAGYWWIIVPIVIIAGTAIYLKKWNHSRE